VLPNEITQGFELQTPDLASCRAEAINLFIAENYSTT